MCWFHSATVSFFFSSKKGYKGAVYLYQFRLFLVSEFLRLILEVLPSQLRQAETSPFPAFLHGEGRSVSSGVLDLCHDQQLSHVRNPLLLRAQWLVGAIVFAVPLYRQFRAMEGMPEIIHLQRLLESSRVLDSMS